MPKKEANNFIKELKLELESFKDENQVAKINTVINQVDQNLIKESNTDKIEHIEDLIQSAIREIEANHPKATALLNNFLNTLSSIGI